MKQILHDFRSGKVILADVPRPGAQRNTILVRNLFSAVSPGTERAVIHARSRNVIRTAFERKDLVRRVVAKARRDGILATVRAVSRKLDSSLPLGYSSAGRVMETGADVTDIRAGDLVACAGAGYACHAEYVSVPRMLCVKLPEGVGADAAAFTTLGAIAVQGVRQAEPRFGETVAVIGLGIMGQLTAQIVEAAGGVCIGMDVDAARVEMFRKACTGNGILVDSAAVEKVASLTDRRGADRVIITAASRSNDVIQLAASICADRGRIVVVGDVSMELPRQPFYEKELEIRLSRSYGPGRYDPSYEVGGIDYPIAYVRWTENRNMGEFLRLVERGSVQPLKLVTHRYAMPDAPKAYNAMAEGQGRQLGILIEYPAESREVSERRVTIQPRGRRTGHVGVGVLGAGNFTRSILLPTLAKVPDVRIVAIGSARGVNARDLATRFKCEFCTTDFNEMLSRDDIDAVFIATPHHLHAEQALRALAAEKSVYLEKPLCIREEDVGPLLEAMRRTEQCVFVGYNRRFSPMGVRMREVFAGRKRPIVLHYRVNAGFVPPESWVVNPEIGGGRIIGEACHFVDFARFVVGCPVRKTVALGTGETPDDVVAALHFDDGSVATISYMTSGPSALSKEYIEATGEGKTCLIEDYRKWVLFDSSGRNARTAVQDKGHRAAFKQFIQCVAGKAVSAFTPEELGDTSRITFKMQKATQA